NQSDGQIQRASKLTRHRVDLKYSSNKTRSPRPIQVRRRAVSRGFPYRPPIVQGLPSLGAHTHYDSALCEIFPLLEIAPFTSTGTIGASGTIPAFCKSSFSSEPSITSFSKSRAANASKAPRLRRKTSRT